MAGIRRALLLSTGDRYFSLISNFLTVAIVSRMLTPAEIGVSVIGMAIVGFASSVREFASSSFVIQRPDLTRTDIQSAFTVMLGFTLLIASVLLLAAPFLANFYEEAGLRAYLRIVALGMMLDLISTIIITLLRRDMAFGKVAAINVAGVAVAAVTTVGLAHMGFSYQSFAIAWLASAAAMAIISFIAMPHPWIFRPTLSHWREMAAFGGYHGATVFLFKIYEMVPSLVLGRLQSPTAAALFNRSIALCQIPDKLILSGAMSVMLPAFAAAARSGRALRRPYLGAVEIITALHWTALLMIALLAYPIVNVVLGNQWLEVVPLVRIIAIASLFSFSFEINYPVMISLGAIRDLFKRALIAFPVSAAIITAAAWAGGVHAMAWSMMIVIPFQAYVSLTFVKRRLRIRWIQIYMAVRKSAVVAIASMLGPILVAAILGDGLELSFRASVVAVLISGMAWLATLAATRHPLFDELAHAASHGIRPLIAYLGPAQVHTGK